MVDPIEIARWKLLDREKFSHNLDGLLELISLAKLPPLSEQLMDQYRSGRRVRSSEAYELTVDEQSTVASKGAYDMSNFDLTSLTGTSRLSTTYLELDVEKIREQVKNQLFQSSSLMMSEFMSTAIPIIENLRKYFVYLRSKKYPLAEASVVQPLMTVLLEKISELVGVDKNPCPGSQLPFGFDVEVLDENRIQQRISLKGKSDIIKLKTNGDSFDDIQFLLELKVPFNTLYRSTADTAKDQLICQLLGIWRHSNNKKRKSVAGALTDLFCIIFACSYSSDKKMFYVVKSAVSTEEYLLHMCLLFIENKKVESVLLEALKLGPKVPSSKRSHGQESSKDKAKQARTQSSAASKEKGGKSSASADNSKKRKTTVYMTQTEYEDIACSEADLNRWCREHYGVDVLSKENVALLGNIIQDGY
jgi:hypothetical protein